MRALLCAALLLGSSGAEPVHAVPAAAAQDLPATTRQVVLERADRGYRWKITEAPLPKLGDHDVLVHVHAIGLNRGDVDILGPDEGHDHSGLVPASDAAGEVVAVGAAVTGFHKGERVTNTYFRDWTSGPYNQQLLTAVYGWTINGLLGDYVALADTAVVRVAPGLSDEEAATLPTAGLTAWTAVTEARKLKPGDTVLVQGTGGVAVFAMQFAASMGARVIVTSSSDDKLARVHTLGASEGINYRNLPKWSERVREITQGRGVDLVVELGGKDTLEQSVQSLADSGALSLVGGLSGYDGVLPAEGLLMKRVRVQGIFVGSRADFEHMNAFIAEHHIRPVVDRTFPLQQYAEALDYMRRGNFIGKIVIRLQ
jgi:NADPH:quinone reductase-like Zn-dependent oxidoreductase